MPQLARKFRQSGSAVVETVAIIGGDPGGLTTALALRKQGLNAQVYERAHSLRPIGAGLTLAPNGLKVLAALEPGIVESLKRAGSQLRLFNLKKSTGETLLQNRIALREKYGQPLLGVRWSRLQEILAAALPPDIIHLNHRCIGFEQNDSGVEAHFDRGKTLQADLLIGADGINSAVRQALIGDGPPRYAGRMSWRALIKYSHELLPPDEVITMTPSNGGKHFLLLDVGHGYIFWSAGALSEDGSISQSAAEVKSGVLEEFAGWAEPVGAIVGATDAADIVERPICDRPPLASWSHGRVTLLGDAAHAMRPFLGQGANTAFEDACEIAQCLGNAPRIEAALASYEKSRIQRTQVIQARSAFQGNRAYEPDSETYLRGVMERALVGNDEFEEWLYRYEPSFKEEP